MFLIFLYIFATSHNHLRKIFLKLYIAVELCNWILRWQTITRFSFASHFHWIPELQHLPWSRRIFTNGVVKSTLIFSECISLVSSSAGSRFCLQAAIGCYKSCYVGVLIDHRERRHSPWHSRMTKWCALVFKLQPMDFQWFHRILGGQENSEIPIISPFPSIVE